MYYARRLQGVSNPKNGTAQVEEFAMYDLL